MTNRQRKVRRLPAFLPWRRLASAVLAAGMWWTAGCAPAPDPRPHEAAADRAYAGDPAIDRAIAAVYPALARIHVVTVDFNDGREQRFEAGGSGVIISADGYVVTNHHVAGKAKWIHCILANREELDATLVGTDPLGDISILKLTLPPDHAPLPFARFGDSAKLRVGDPVLAMGSPLTISQSVTKGMVSNTNMTIPDFFWPFTFTLDGETVGELVRWIGHDAAIYGGNSGGPLVNLNGEIVGINEISLGLAGAIPGNLAKQVADDIIAHGKVRRSWTGMELQPVLHSRSAAYLQAAHQPAVAPTPPPPIGAMVSGVVENSPAAKAGILPGDILLTYNGAQVNIRFSEELPDINRRMLETPVGSTVLLTLLRDNQTLEKTITTEIREAARGEDDELTEWGLTVRDFTRMSALEAQHAQTGVYVWSLREGGPASEAKPPLRTGDVIVQVGDQPVATMADLQRVTAAAVKDAQASVPVLVHFERKTEKLLTAVELNRKDHFDNSPEIQKAWLPIQSQVLSQPLVKTLGLPADTTGIRITALLPGFDQALNGLQVGDLILKLDGERIEASQPEDLDVFPTMIRQYKIGSSATLTLLRDGQERKLNVTLVGRPEESRQVTNYENTQFDFKARDLVYADRVGNRWPLNQTGVLVTSVEPGGWAAVAHMAVHDLILGLNGQPVKTADDLKQALASLSASKPEYAVFFVRRGIHTFYLEVQTNYEIK